MVDRPSAVTQGGARRDRGQPERSAAAGRRSSPSASAAACSRSSCAGSWIDGGPVQAVADRLRPGSRGSSNAGTPDPGRVQARVRNRAGADRPRPPRRRDRNLGASPTAHGGGALGPLEESLLPALADVLDETLDDLRAERDPRRAVIAAYARMERALAAYGFPRDAAEAPDEYLERILADLEVQPPRYVSLDGVVLLGEVLVTRCGAGDEAGGDRGARGRARRAARGRDPGRAPARRGASPSSASGQTADADAPGG